MRVVKGKTEWIVSAPAKINLFLEIAGKRPDGFHEIATLMVGIGLRDTLAFTEDPDGGLSLTCDRPGLSTGDDNLVLRAARLLREATGSKRGARIRLKKRIPMAAGLAGGSADAAATLIGLDRLWDMRMPSAELATLSSRLGSDIPFFFSLPAAWCTGRGEIVTPVRAPRAFDAVLILPPFGCDTAQVYRRLKLDGTVTSGDDRRAALEAGDVERFGSWTFANRLEAAAFQVAPELATIKEASNRVAPLGVTLSGSGSTLYALCRNHGEAVDLAHRMRRLPELAECGLRPIRTLSSPSFPPPAEERETRTMESSP